MLRKLILLLSIAFLTFGIASAQTADETAGIKFIKDFYTAIINSNGQEDEDGTKVMIEKYVTPEFYEKALRITAATEADPFTRSEDMPDELLKTLKIKALSDGWYMVSFASPEEEGERIQIPLHITTTEGKPMIDYVTPEWDGIEYGKKMFYTPKEITIDQSSALAFLKSFYAAYTNEYCSIPLGLTERLNDLREANFTKKALAQIDMSMSEEESKLYDPVIMDFDFDPLWLPSLKVTDKGNGRFQVSYTVEEWSAPVIGVTVVKENGRYMIDVIQENEGE